MTDQPNNFLDKNHVDNFMLEILKVCEKYDLVITYEDDKKSFSLKRYNDDDARRLWDARALYWLAYSKLSLDNDYNRYMDYLRSKGVKEPEKIFYKRSLSWIKSFKTTISDPDTGEQKWLPSFRDMLEGR